MLDSLVDNYEHLNFWRSGEDDLQISSKQTRSVHSPLQPQLSVARLSRRVGHTMTNCSVREDASSKRSGQTTETVLYDLERFHVRRRNMANDVVATEHAPAAIGPYSQGIKANGFLFTAGQIPLIPETMEIVEGGIAEQTERVMENLAAILQEAGTSFDRVVKTTCYLANFGDFA